MATLAPAIDQLRTDVNAAWPKRSKATDGTWGDLRHQKKKSDHNTGDAIDVTNDPASGPAGDTLAAYAIRDPRVKYVIWNRRIYDKRRANPGWRPYGEWEETPHDHHVHVSVWQAARADTSPYAWLQQGPPPPIDIPGETKFEDSDPVDLLAKGDPEVTAKHEAYLAKVAARRKKKKKKTRGLKVTDASIDGPKHIYDGEASVLLGTKMRMAAHVESPHTGGGKVAKGSPTVFVGTRQLAFARKGDPTTDNLNVKTGHEAILVG